MTDQGIIYRFGNITLKTDDHSLLKGEEEVHLRPKVFETLLYLIERHGHLVKKDELIGAIWRNVIVTENTLNKCIEELRGVLKDNPHQPVFIQTIPRVGFKFIADVKKIMPGQPGEEASLEVYASSNDKQLIKPGFKKPFRFRNVVVISSIIPLIFILILVSIKFLTNNRENFDSIAVLPFTNLSNPDQEYFADGMTEALIAELAKVSLTKVISRTSVMNYKNVTKPLPEIANELNVDLILEGSVQNTGKRVLVIVQLINPLTNRHIWVESYERDIQDILMLQQELAQTIASKIKMEMIQTHSVSVDKVDPVAFEAYLKGRFFWNKRTPDNFRKAIDYFDQAIKQDPDYALAYVGIADCYNMLSNYDAMHPEAAYSKVSAALTEAFRINNELAEAHASLAFTKMFYEWDMQEAEKILLRAIEVNPNLADAHHWYGLCLAMQKRFDEALSEMKTALSLDPLSIIINTNVGWVYYFARRYDDAIKQIQHSLELDSTFISGHIKLGWAYEQIGKSEEAIKEFQTGLRLAGNDPALLAILGHAYALANRKNEALEIIGKLKERSDKEYITSYMIAVIYSGLGNEEQAIVWLQKAIQEKDGWIAWLKVDPKLDPIRDSPEFIKLMNLVGFK
jgi:TolB-like protein/DNA-binding winged helix-turn-helix (wHTH) protein/tetratricopeptide (TPR) repeat protein